VGSLIGVSLVALLALGGLVIWHLIRRGRLIQAAIPPPRPLKWPELERNLEPERKPRPDPKPSGEDNPRTRESGLP